jgi:hypothetical protein
MLDMSMGASKVVVVNLISYHIPLKLESYLQYFFHKINLKILG